ncbi:hypothetical protein THOD03_140018 [Vibrio harveyi]|nr:hypothetical protein THOD03_140018 [Vibrio harveyi]
MPLKSEVSVSYYCFPEPIFFNGSGFFYLVSLNAKMECEELVLAFCQGS